MIYSAALDVADALDVRRPHIPASQTNGDGPGARQARRRAGILAAARGLFAEGGSDFLTMRRIAARSGSTVPTIYRLVGNRSAVVEQALLEHLANCIAIAPLVAERLGVNVVNGFGDALWLAAQAEPAFARRQVLLVRHELDGRRLGALFVQTMTAAIQSWVSELCGRSRLAKRLGHDQIAAAIEAQLRTALLDWAEGNDSAAAMRLKLARAPAICLARFIDEQEMARLSAWLSALGRAS